VSPLKKGTAKTLRTPRTEKARENLCDLCVFAVKNPLFSAESSVKLVLSSPWVCGRTKMDENAGNSLELVGTQGELET
jgi:hypothetical protein